ncbi:hypothetical protein J6590_009341 [Homalodisca vitripennis]|nr:hypothetical protein J6590_009341 [Homalodisca vitripennis]
MHVLLLLRNPNLTSTLRSLLKHGRTVPGTEADFDICLDKVPKRRKRTRRQYTSEDLNRAIQAIRCGAFNVATAARLFGIPQTTLNDKTKKSRQWLRRKMLQASVKKETEKSIYSDDKFKEAIQAVKSGKSVHLAVQECGIPFSSPRIEMVGSYNHSNKRPAPLALFQRGLGGDRGDGGESNLAPHPAPDDPPLLSSTAGRAVDSTREGSVRMACGALNICLVTRQCVRALSAHTQVATRKDHMCRPLRAASAGGAADAAVGRRAGVEAAPAAGCGIVADAAVGRRAGVEAAPAAGCGIVADAAVGRRAGVEAAPAAGCGIVADAAVGRRAGVEAAPAAGCGIVADAAREPSLSSSPSLQLSFELQDFYRNNIRRVVVRSGSYFFGLPQAERRTTGAAIRKKLIMYNSFYYYRTASALMQPAQHVSITNSKSSPLTTRLNGRSPTGHGQWWRPTPPAIPTTPF